MCGVSGGAACGAIFALSRRGDMYTRTTLAKIAVMSVLLGAVLGASPAMELMRRHGIWPMATAQVRAVSATRTQQTAARSLPRAGSQAPSPTRGLSQAKKKKKKPEPFDRYEMPAGGVLPALLRAPLDSRTARVHEGVRAILRRSLKQDGMELIPAASIIHGKVIDVVPASRWQPRGRIAVAFSSIEHGRTGTRIAIAARPLVFEPPEAPGARRSVDVRVNAGEVVHITLTQMLVIRLPK